MIMPDNHLIVLMHGVRAGMLTQQDGVQIFAYDNEFQSNDASTPVSLSLPIVQREHRGAKLVNYLWGLLPDNPRVLARWGAQFDTSPKNPFGLLAHVGEDCPGAIQFVRPERLEMIQESDAINPVDDDWIANKIKALRTDSAAWLPTEERTDGQWSLAGAQPKFALVRDGAGWATASGIRPTTHIFKPNVSPFPHFDLNEQLCLHTARLLGLPTANSALHQFKDEVSLVVDRYDRTSDGGRVHQEDLCQALGISPLNKYQNEGGPTVAGIAELLRQNVDRDHRDDCMLQLARILAFNWLIVNTDGHAKNFSVLLSGRNVRLAPLYDVASGLPYQRITPGKIIPGELNAQGLRMALKIGGEYEATQIDQQCWRVVATELRLDPDMLLSEVSQLAQKIPDKFQQAIVDAGDIADPEFAGQMLERVESRAKLCSQTLRGQPQKRHDY